MVAAGSKQDILDRLRSVEDQVRGLGVRRMSLFGSFVRDNPGSDSDVDLLVEFQPGQKSFDNFMALSSFLDELFQRPVELVTFDSLSPYIGPRILDEAEDVVRTLGPIVREDSEELPGSQASADR